MLFKLLTVLLEYSENIEELVVAPTHHLITAWTFFRNPEIPYIVGFVFGVREKLSLLYLQNLLGHSKYPPK